ncbi:hypothetical protein [Lachnobacterium bovis]|uniref:hypothetical protein n=1 Tax=Lachnobacterium bovis TaxID=140626 RepID=UPI000485351B|nr:hypothetical protein [Lachnobacterium bovis]
MKNIRKKLFIMAIFLSIVSVPEGKIDAETLSINVLKERINKGDIFEMSFIVFDGDSSRIEVNYDKDVIEFKGKNTSVIEKKDGQLVLDVENEKQKGSKGIILDFKAKTRGVTTVKACAFDSKDKNGNETTINAVAKVIDVKNTDEINKDEIYNAEIDKDDTLENLEYEDKDILFYGNDSYEIKSEIPQKIIPNDFITTTVKIDNKEYPALVNYKYDMKLLYLKKQIFDLSNSKKQKDTSSLFIYDEKQKEIYPFLQLYTDNECIIPTFLEKADIPKKYFEREIVIKNQKIKVLVSNYDEFCLVYCYNDSGSRGWYKYNISEGKFMNYVKSLSAERFYESKIGKEAINIVEKGASKIKMNNYNYLILAACLIILLNILLKYKANRKMKKRLIIVNLFSIDEDFVEESPSYEYSKKDLQNVKDKDEFERESQRLLDNSDLEFIDGK